MANLPNPWRGSFLSHPFRDFSRYQDRLDKLMNEIMDLRGEMPSAGAEFSPSCELTEEDKKFLLKVDLPGVKKDDVKVEVSGDRLTIRAERKTEKEEKDKKRYFSEVSYGNYMRSFSLPQKIDEKSVDAKFDNGVLVVTIPKTEESNAKQISIH